MNDTENERSEFRTPSNTPHLDPSTAPQDYFDPESSSSKQDSEQRIPNTRNISEIYHPSCQSDDDEHESDTQDQQPTEATDDSDDPSHLPILIPTTIDESSPVQRVEEQTTNTLSSIQEIEPVEDSSLSIITSDKETSATEEPIRRPRLNYSLSSCIPYTDKQDDMFPQKEILTTSTFEFTGLDMKKGENDLGHIMISYNHSTRLQCSRIAQCLRDHHYKVWIDQDDISGNIFTSMASAVENCSVVLMAINEQYFQSRYCRLEAEYTVEQNKAWIPMLMQTGYKAFGWLGIINGAKLYVDFSQLSFDEAFGRLVREIEAVRIELGADRNDRIVPIPANNAITTTMNASWLHQPNVQDWTARDVIDWLHAEKLEVFENSLRNFTGATLWQFYKIKFDSPPEYYRLVDSLLSPTDPLRLFFQLTFNAALEALFAFSPQKMHR